MKQAFNTLKKINALNDKVYSSPYTESKTYLAERDELISELKRYCKYRGINYENLKPLWQGYRRKPIYHNKIRAAKEAHRRRKEQNDDS